MRCEYIRPTGQCRNEAISPSRFCEEHSATSAQTIINQYRITSSALGDSPQRHAQTEQLKSLRGELVILRSLLESRLNMIESDAELVAAIPAIKDLAIAVEKIATSCHNMDVKLANLLDKAALMSLAQEIISIIEKNLRPFANTEVSSTKVDETIEKIGQEIVQAIAKQENPNAKR